MGTVLECTNLNKSYGRNDAVKDMNIKLEENTVYGLLGRNGAGKTTLLNLLSGSIFPDSGNISVFGRLLKRGETPGGFCYVKEKSLFFGGASMMQLLELASAYHENWDWDFAKELLKAFKLNPGKKFCKLSRGMESMIGIIIGMASRAPLTVFDEPVLGLDVLMREKFYSILLEDYAQNPRTIVISTHLVDEIARVIEKVVIIDSGELILQDDIEGIRSKSYFVSGKDSSVEELVKGKNVIHRESFANVRIASVFDTIGEKEKLDAKRLELSIEGMPLQKFFAYLVEGREQN